MTVRTRVAAALGCVALALLPACAPAARELARGPAGARGTVLLLEALAARFGPVSREPAFDALRPKLASAALVPSRVFDDPAAWTARGEGWRGVELAGARFGPAYRIGVRPAAPEPSAPGDYRGRLQLRRLANGRYEWQMQEELAIGTVRPAEIAAALTALFREAERLAGTASPRDLVASALPRAAAVVGQACRIERLQLPRDAAGGTAVEAVVRLTPDALARTAPRYAAFLRRYVSPMKLHAVAADAAGATWWTLEGLDGAWTLRLRVRDGSLAPLAGPARGGIPSQLRVTIDYQTRMGRLTVGVRSLAAQLTLTRGAREKGFRAHFAQEPGWQLPFLVAPLLRGSLRYPFEAEGSEAGWSVRELPGGGVQAVRSYRGRVRESWLVRWLGGLTTNAVDDFRRGAEAEADAYHRACLLALRDDLLALSTP